MSQTSLLLWLIAISRLLIIIVSRSDPIPPTIPAESYIINCGGGASGDGTTETGIKYVSDDSFISAGESATVNQPDEVLPLLSTLRHFPDVTARKHCFSVPVTENGKYLVRTTYFYGGFDGRDSPPVFDQIVDGTRWSEVDTVVDYASGFSSFYEIVVVAGAPSLSVCLARNERTAPAASPFISALDVRRLDDSMYNMTDFGKFALSTVDRSYFGGGANGVIGFPDDKYNRLWRAYKDLNPIVTSHATVTPSSFWNLPPKKAFGTALTTSRGKTLHILWPPSPLVSGDFYVTLYFQDNRTPSPYSWRVFNVLINGNTFYGNLNVTTGGVAVSSPMWPLSGRGVISLVPAPGSPVGPVINAAEILQVLPLGGKTLPGDEMTMIELAKGFKNPPSDWAGDPCLPKENSWTGITCSQQGKFARVFALNLTGMGISGSLSASVANLASLNHLWLGGNKLSGTIPESWSLKELKTLHLENNQLEGPIPNSLGQIPSLHEIFLQNNKLDREIPASLRNQYGKIIRV